MAGREAFQRFAQQLTQQTRAKAGGGGGGGGGPTGGQALGGIGLFAVIGGGLLLNSSLFNGLSLAHVSFYGGVAKHAVFD